MQACLKWIKYLSRILSFRTDSLAEDGCWQCHRSDQICGRYCHKQYCSMPYWLLAHNSWICVSNNRRADCLIWHCLRQAVGDPHWQDKSLSVHLQDSLHSRRRKDLDFRDKDLRRGVHKRSIYRKHGVSKDINCLYWSKHKQCVHVLKSNCWSCLLFSRYQQPSQCEARWNPRRKPSLLPKWLHSTVHRFRHSFNIKHRKNRIQRSMCYPWKLHRCVF